jgi:hypothetical protein
VDETGTRHAGNNGFCTQISNDWFTWFGTRFSKSRLNFLDLLRAGHTITFSMMRHRSCRPAGHAGASLAPRRFP